MTAERDEQADYVCILEDEMAAEVFVTQPDAYRSWYCRSCRGWTWHAPRAAVENRRKIIHHPSSIIHS
jgi:hypothetical protein